MAKKYSEQTVPQGPSVGQQNQPAPVIVTWDPAGPGQGQPLTQVPGETDAPFGQPNTAKGK